MVSQTFSIIRAKILEKNSKICNLWVDILELLAPRLLPQNRIIIFNLVRLCGNSQDSGLTNPGLPDMFVFVIFSLD